MSDAGGGDDGGGSDGGVQFGALTQGSEASAEQVTLATDWLSKNTDGWDAKSIEGKKPSEVWNLARTGEQAAIAARASDPFKGTPYEGIKVPAKFVIEKDGKKVVDATALAKSYGELERAQFRRREEVRNEAKAELEADRRKAAPATPGDYTPSAKIVIKDQTGKEREAFGVTIGERQVEIIADDPQMNFMREVAHKHGIGQDEFHEIVKGYVAASLSSGPQWTDEAKKLGGVAIAEKREGRVAAFLKGNLSADNYGFFARMPSTQRGIEAIEQLMTLSGHPPFIPEASDIPGESYTRAEIKKMQSDPRYTGEGRPGGADKEFVKTVRAAWRRLAA